MSSPSLASVLGDIYKSAESLSTKVSEWTLNTIPGAQTISGMSGTSKTVLFSGLVAAIVYVRIQRERRRAMTGSRLPTQKQGQGNTGVAQLIGKQVGRDGKEHTFFERLKRIISIILRGRYGKNVTFALGCLSVLLVARTMLSIQVAMRTGSIAEQLVQQNWEGFVSSVAHFLLMGVPAAFVNALLKYLTTILALYSQKQLSDFINLRYINGTNFYKATQLPSTKIENVDQRVTADVQQFCHDLATLYSSVFKPVLDVVLNSWKLSEVMGAKAPFIIFVAYSIFGKMQMSMLQTLDIKNNAKRLSEHEGMYRTAHSRLIVYAEEIAFFEGAEREREIIGGLFNNLFEHHRQLEWLKAIVGVFDQFILKYATSITGYSLMAIPVFFTPAPPSSDPAKPAPGRDPATLTRNYVLNRQLLMDLSTAIGTLLSTATSIASFAGITQRVSEVLEQVELLNAEMDDQINKDNFKLRPADDDKASGPVAVGCDSKERQIEWLAAWARRGEDNRKKNLRRVGSSKISLVAAGGAGISSLSGKGGLASLQADFEDDLAKDDGKQYLSKTTFTELGNVYHTPQVIIAGSPTAPAGLKSTRGADSMIRFIDTAIVSPDGRLLVKNLNLTIKQGTNMMLTGSNGTGKSSLFRVLGGLWPPYAGTIIKPANSDILFVPQKPYLVTGCLRDQVIYPHTIAEMKAIGVTDDDLMHLLDIVDPARSITREWKFDDVRDWNNAFSGGQKQRVAMARVFYHRPRYAILDECTSAVSADVEGAIYRTCRLLNISIFTVSHRAGLQQYHDIQLRLDGNGKYSIFTTEQLLQQQQHIQALEEQQKQQSMLLGQTSSGVPVGPTSAGGKK